MKNSGSREGVTLFPSPRLSQIVLPVGFKKRPWSWTSMQRYMAHMAPIFEYPINIPLISLMLMTFDDSDHPFFWSSLICLAFVFQDHHQSVRNLKSKAVDPFAIFGIVFLVAEWKYSGHGAMANLPEPIWRTISLEAFSESLAGRNCRSFE